MFLEKSLKYLHCLLDNIGKKDSFRRRKSVSASHVRTYKMIEGGIEYSGYIDIKQPPKIKGRKLKSWKKKWVIVHEMSIRSAGRSAAKVDVYSDEKTAKNSPADKQTFILEFVTDIRSAKSKTHSHAFEIVERDPVLLLAGSTELDTQSWMSTFKKIFFPEQEENDMFPVTIVPNEHAARLSLAGLYSMTVNPEVIAIVSKEKNSYEWSLNMLKRFHLVKDTENPTIEILSIECGPKSECGEAIFQFSSDHVTKILASIKANIFIALNRKKAEKHDKNSPTNDMTERLSVKSNTGSIDSACRTRSSTSGSMEQRYKDLLETSANNQTKPLHSPNSDNSMDSETTGDVNDLKRKHRPSVTFETPVINECTSTDDLLSSPVEVKDEDKTSDYNTVEFHLPKSTPQVGNIISTFTVAKPGYKTKVLLDENGYSHVDIQSSKPVFSDDKTRSLSNMSSHSSVSCRSASVGSRDSGILYTAVDKAAKFERGIATNRSTNSFDSAVSTSTVDMKQSCPIDTNAANLTVEIQEIEVTHEEFKNGRLDTDSKTMEVNDNGIYQDVSIEENKCEDKNNGENAYARANPKLRKCNSAGDFKAEEKENEYEDLDNFRKGKKNLIKHLGMDPTVDPKSVPPSLPERPSSYKMKRKFNTGDKKLFTLPFTKNKNRKQKERTISLSSSSDSDSESTRGSTKTDEMAVKVWPLGNKSVIAGNEDLYQPIAIERFLKDNDGMSVPQKRERSSSLNLNMSSAMKRPTASHVRNSEPVDRRNTLWKHNRNVSMQVDMLNRTNNSLGLKQNFDMSLQPGLFGRIGDNSSDSIDMEFADDEPIYAEVGPTTKSSSGDIENPFPDLTVWTPANISDVAEVTELDETKYENDESMQSLNNADKGDMLNQGFVIDDEMKSCDKCDNESMLIDLSEINPAHNGNSTKTAIDIFNMGMGTSLLETSTLTQGHAEVSNSNGAVNFIDIFHMGCGTPLPSSSSDLLNKSVMPVISGTITNPSNSLTMQSEATVTSSNAQAHESIYMDMNSCKNESIYVLPSSLKR
ncbi:serine-rich adhesin for platelets-like isoform X2 [Ruditapes philippinarum]|uniref:serine-rich adhesin for platelets-like isoform X2 n=1 Tax=Ruditapes philippinarum TaxID=129788 RepID=UPI00295B3312|nr:serine-rich adhesin for platelets-like isoform X2 [Ruditapes philippinarum]